MIFQAGERVIAKYGLAAAPVEEIAREAQVSVGTLYRAFPGGKTEIYRAIIEQRSSEVIAIPRAAGLLAWEKSQDVIDAVLAGIAALVEYMVAHPDYLRMTLQDSWLFGDENLTVQQLSIRAEGMNGTIEAMKFGIESGAFVNIDPKLLARSVVAMEEAHLGHWLERRNPTEEVITGLQEMFMRAFCRQEALDRRKSR